MHKLYENIKRRRIELGLSQSKLAEMMGYSDKTMISKIESGSVDLNISKVEAFAEKLLVEPHILMGWDEDEKMPTTLDDGQEQLLRLYANSDSLHRDSAVLTLKDGQLPSEHQN